MNSLLDEYKRNYQDFITAIQQVSVVTSVSSVSLSDFPENLHPVLSEPYNKILATIAEYQRKAEEQGANKVEYDIEFEENQAMPLVFMVLSHISSGKGDEEIDFKRIIASQHIVMTFAYLDAFMNDSIRLVCKAQPNVLKTNKTISWEKAIATGGWDNFIDSLVDEYVYEFGWQNVASRIESMEKRFGIKLKLPPDEIPFLNNAENIRHIFVHNGGRVTQQYLDKTKDSGIAIGSPIPIDDEYLAQLTRIVTNVSGELFATIVEKFFKVNLDDEQISVWKTGTHVKSNTG